MSADNPTAGTPAEQARHRAARRVELAVEASDALTKLVEDLEPHETGFSEANRLAFGVDDLLKVLQRKVPR